MCAAGRYFLPGKGAVSLLETWTGVLAFAGQIYGDFAGYTDMAIGAALIIGFKIPRNFNLPYFAVLPVDFWRRWHISLSSWLRDYLYISLGGRNQRLRNVMITMVLGGLWHGAAWTFVAWGFFHGIIITATHWLGNLKTFAGFATSRSKLITILKCTCKTGSSLPEARHSNARSGSSGLSWSCRRPSVFSLERQAVNSSTSSSSEMPTQRRMARRRGFLVEFRLRRTEPDVPGIPRPPYRRRLQRT